MPATYTLISSNVLTSTAATVTFSAIPATYTDLVLRYSLRTDRAGETWDIADITFNGNTSSLYSMTNLDADGSAASSARVANNTSLYSSRLDAAAATSNTFGNGELYIPSYTASQNKAISDYGVQETNGSVAYIRANAFLFRSTTAISSIKFAPTFGTNFVSGSSFYLYGISNA